MPSSALPKRMKEVDHVLEGLQSKRDGAMKPPDLRSRHHHLKEGLRCLIHRVMTITSHEHDIKMVLLAHRHLLCARGLKIPGHRLSIVDFELTLAFVTAANS